MTHILWAINLRWGIWYGLQHALVTSSSASVMSAASSAFMVVLSGLSAAEKHGHVRIIAEQLLCPSAGSPSSHRGPHPQTT